jgi:hypothetical protein
MWKRTFDLIRQFLLLNEISKRNQEKLTELQREVHNLSRTTDQGFQHMQGMIERLAYEVKRLEAELRHSREREADARERLRLELEIKMLSEKRQLPPAANGNDKDNGSER